MQLDFYVSQMKLWNCIHKSTFNLRRTCSLFQSACIHVHIFLGSFVVVVVHIVSLTKRARRGRGLVCWGAVGSGWGADTYLLFFKFPNSNTVTQGPLASPSVWTSLYLRTKSFMYCPQNIKHHYSMRGDVLTWRVLDRMKLNGEMFESNGF